MFPVSKLDSQKEWFPIPWCLWSRYRVTDNLITDLWSEGLNKTAQVIFVPPNCAWGLSRYFCLCFSHERCYFLLHLAARDVSQICASAHSCLIHLWERQMSTTYLATVPTKDKMTAIVITFIISYSQYSSYCMCQRWVYVWHLRRNACFPKHRGQEKKMSIAWLCCHGDHKENMDNIEALLQANRGGWRFECSFQSNLLLSLPDSISKPSSSAFRAHVTAVFPFHGRNDYGCMLMWIRGRLLVS